MWKMGLIPLSTLNMIVGHVQERVHRAYLQSAKARGSRHIWRLRSTCNLPDGSRQEQVDRLWDSHQQRPRLSVDLLSTHQRQGAFPTAATTMPPQQLENHCQIV